MNEQQTPLDLPTDLTTVEDYQFEPIKCYPMLHWRGKRPFTSIHYYPAQLKERHGDAYIIVEVKADNQIVAPVVQAKKEFAQQMAVASGMTYHIIKASDANQGLYTHLLTTEPSPIQVSLHLNGKGK